MQLYKKIIRTSPLLEVPTMRMMPISNVLVSSLIKSKEYMSKIEMSMNISSTILNIKWKNSIPIENSCIICNTNIYAVNG
jgi:hypothetical protein